MATVLLSWCAKVDAFELFIFMQSPLRIAMLPGFPAAIPLKWKLQILI